MKDLRFSFSQDRISADGDYGFRADKTVLPLLAPVWWARMRAIRRVEQEYEQYCRFMAMASGEIWRTVRTIMDSEESLRAMKAEKPTKKVKK